MILLAKPAWASRNTHSLFIEVFDQRTMTARQFFNSVSSSGNQAIPGSMPRSHHTVQPSPSSNSTEQHRSRSIWV